MALLCGAVEQVTFQKLWLGCSWLRTQVSSVPLQTQLRTKLSPTFSAQPALQTVLKPSNWFILSSPLQVELPAQLHPCDLVYTSSAEFEDPILPIALATRIFADRIGHSSLLKTCFLRPLLSPQFYLLTISVIFCIKEPRDK